MAIPRNLSDFAPKLTTGGGFGSGSAATPTALGTVYGLTNLGGNLNASFGYQAGNTSTGTNNTFVGYQAGYTNNNNRCTFLGYRAGYLSDALENTFLGYQAGVAITSGDYNTFVGTGAGSGATTGARNTFVGRYCAEAVTTGSRNTVIGWYNGNQDGLDIRTASNYAVISDGDGNRLLSTANGQTLALDGGAVPNSGTGITFPATQSASSDANTLDDYEEGTWTPTDNSGAGLSFTGVSATYTKVGRIVTCLCELNYPVTASGASANIAGLPFTSANVQANRSGGVMTISTTATVQRIYPAINNTTFPLLSGTGAGVTNANCSGVQFNFCITYFV